MVFSFFGQSVYYLYITIFKAITIPTITSWTTIMKKPTYIDFAENFITDHEKKIIWFSSLVIILHVRPYLTDIIDKNFIISSYWCSVVDPYDFAGWSTCLACRACNWKSLWSQSVFMLQTLAAQQVPTGKRVSPRPRWINSQGTRAWRTSALTWRGNNVSYRKL